MPGTLAFGSPKHIVRVMLVTTNGTNLGDTQNSRLNCLLILMRSRRRAVRIRKPMGLTATLLFLQLVARRSAKMVLVKVLELACRTLPDEGIALPTTI